VGIATCNVTSGDDFSLGYGITLAIKRAMTHYYSEKIQRLEKLVQKNRNAREVVRRSSNQRMGLPYKDPSKKRMD
jgi:hypothetical protein